MNKVRLLLLKYWPALAVAAGAAALLSSLLFYKLGTLLPGVSPSELTVLHTPIGWQGILSDPLYLPLLIMRSIAFVLDTHPGALTVRFPDALLGTVAIASFALVVRAWHNWRIALLASGLFASSAWTLHISRYGGNDVLYLLAMPLLLLTRVAVHRRATVLSTSLVLLVWSSLLYTPGLVWLVGLTVFWQRRDLAQAWLKASLKTRVWLGFCSLSWLPLLAYGFTKQSSVALWLGAPAKYDAGAMMHRLAAIPYHLLVHAPAIPELWLGRLPLLDIATLVITVLGFIFYLRNWRAARSQQIFSYLLLGSLVSGIGGVVSLSVVVPILYLVAACGLDLLLRDWFRTFPINPVARAFGIGLIIMVVGLAGFYNLRSYFVAWPHAALTRSTFTKQP